MSRTKKAKTPKAAPKLADEYVHVQSDALSEGEAFVPKTEWEAHGHLLEFLDGGRPNAPDFWKKAKGVLHHGTPLFEKARAAVVEVVDLTQEDAAIPAAPEKPAVPEPEAPKGPSADETPGPRTCTCDNCGKVYTERERGGKYDLNDCFDPQGRRMLGLGEVPNLNERLTIGYTVPAGECTCGALTYLDGARSREAFRSQLKALAVQVADAGMVVPPGVKALLEDE